MLKNKRGTVGVKASRFLMQSAEGRMQNYGVPHYAERIVYAYGGITSQYKYGYDNRGNLVRSIDINDRGDFRKKPYVH